MDPYFELRDELIDALRKCYTMYAREVPAILSHSAGGSSGSGASHSPAVVSSRLDEVYARIQAEVEASEDLLGLLDEMLVKVRPNTVEGGMAAVEERQQFINGAHRCLGEEVSRFADDLRKVGAEMRSGRPIRSSKFVSRHYKDSKGMSLSETRGLVGKRSTLPTVNWELHVLEEDATAVIEMDEAKNSSSPTTQNSTKGGGGLSKAGDGDNFPSPPDILDNDAYVHRQQQLMDSETNEQDELLDRLGDGVRRVREHAVNIGDEVRSQGTIFDRISTDVERTMEKLGAVNVRINVIIENMSNCKKMMVIFFLSGILILLFSLLGS